MSVVRQAHALLKQDTIDQSTLMQLEEDNPGTSQAALDALAKEQEGNEGHGTNQTRKNLVPDPSQDALVDEEVLRRWSIPADAIVKPKNLGQLVDQVQHALDNELAVRPIGSGHAQSDVTNPADDNLVLSGGLMGDVLTVNPDLLKASADAGTLYKCEAGRNIGLIIKDLDAAGLALESMGAGNFHGVVGAIQTATHGSGNGLPCLADLVEAMTVVVVEEGQVKVLVLERGGDRAITDPAAFEAASKTWKVPRELRQDDALFNAMVVCMGTMCVVYSVTLRGVPQYWLHEERVLGWWSDLKVNLLEGRKEVENSRNYEVLVNPYWETNPETGQKDDNRVLITRRKLLTEPSEFHVAGSRPPAMALAKTKAGRAASAAAFGVAIRNPVKRVPNLIRTALPKTAVTSFQGCSFEVLLIQLNIDAMAEEVGVPQELSVEATDIIIKHANANLAGMSRALEGINKPFSKDLDALTAAWREFPLHASPFSLRFVGASEATVAMMYKQATCMIEMPMPGTDHLDLRMAHGEDPTLDPDLELYDAYVSGREKLWADVEDALLPLNVRPHWGLWNTFSFAESAKAYPKWAEWVALVKKYNASGVFDSPFTTRMGLSARDDASDDTVHGQVVVRIPQPKRKPGKAFLKIKEAPGWALWKAMKDAPEKKGKRRGKELIVSSVNVKDPIVGQMNIDGGRLKTIPGWDLFHGLQKKTFGVASLHGNRLTISGDAADTLRTVFAAGGGAIPGEGDITLVAKDLAAGDWYVDRSEK